MRAYLRITFLFLGVAVVSGCVSTQKMYNDFESNVSHPLENPPAAFASVTAPTAVALSQKTTLEFKSSDPILTIDQASGNFGYFHVVQFHVDEAGSYSIMGILNCRCFGKISGKNVAVPRLYLMNTQNHQITAAKPGLITEHVSFVEGDRIENLLRLDLTAGDYRLLVAVDNAAKGGAIHSAQAASYAAGAPIVVSYNIYSAPDGEIDLLIEPTKSEAKK